MDLASIKWDNFKTHVTQAFDSLRKDKDFFDVTLVSEDEVQVPAHRIILASCSPYMKKILKKNQNNTPFMLYLDGINSNDLLHVLDYIYLGEVKVPQKNLPSFIKVSKKLKLEGLMQPKVQQSRCREQPVAQETPKESMVFTQEIPKESMNFAKENPKESMNYAHPAAEEIDFLQLEVQQESRSSSPTSIIGNDSDGSAALNQESDLPPIKLEDPRELDFLKFKSGTLSEISIPTTKKNVFKQNVFSTQDMDLVDKKLEEFSEKLNGVYRCKICLKTAANRTNHHFHIETHMDGLFFQCDQCERTTKTRNAMRKHYGFYHRHAPFNFTLGNSGINSTENIK